MKKNEFRIGKLLDDKNALLNYIYDNNGSKIGVVVGMRGKDRATPHVGWCLFEEIPTVRMDYKGVVIKNYDKLQGPIDKLVNTILNSNIHAADVIESLRTIDAITSMTSIVRELDITDSEVYFAVERSILRANTDRDNFFVCSNPVYGQSCTSIKPTNNKRNPAHIMLEDGGNESICCERTITAVRHAVRKMEFRCWKYFKDDIED